MLGPSGGTGISISQAPLCYGDENTKSETHSLLNQKDGYRKMDALCINTFSFLGAIEIFATQLNHAGRYTCIARNAAGSAHRHVTLYIQGMEGQLFH